MEIYKDQNGNEINMDERHLLDLKLLRVDIDELIKVAENSLHTDGGQKY